MQNQPLFTPSPEYRIVSPLRCVQNTSEESAQKREIVLPVRLGGCFHRRSAFKKNGQWQFTPLNLTLHLLYASPSTSTCPDDVEVVPSVTCGSAAAHAMKFNQGGLRSLIISAAAPPPTAGLVEKKTGLLRRGSSSEIGKSTMGGERATVRSGMLSLNSYAVMDTLLSEATRAYRAALPPPPPPPSTAAQANSPTPPPPACPSLQDLPSLRLLQSLLRCDMACSQCLTLALTSLSAFLGLCHVSRRHRTLLPRVLSAGFLVSVESLLTTAGKEQGMLEDLSAAATWLSTISVRLLTRTSASASASAEGGEEEVVVGRCEDISVWRRRGEGALVVDLWLSERDATLVASTMAKYRIQVRDVEGGERMLRRSGSNLSQPSQALEGEEGEVVGVLSLTGVLVSQGINVLQSLSNLVWNPSSLHINDEALAVRPHSFS